VFALVAGLGTALLLARYLDKKGGGGQAVAVTGVVVAAVDLPLAARLKVEDLKVIEWPADHVPPGAITDPKELVGRVLISRVLAQQPLLPGMLAAKNAGSGLAALIPSNMRAIAVRVDDVVGVAGFIHADDRVDVMVTMRPYQGSESTTKVFLQNVKVLAVGQDVDNGEKSRLHATQATVATLLVSPQDAERLVLAQTEGRIMLTLRSWTDSLPVDTNGANPSGLIGGAAPVAAKDSGANGGAARPQAAARRGRGKDKGPQPPTLAADQTPPQKDTVEILRGDRFEQRNFNRGEKR
jgi:pilus assembly protein CpaB